MKSVPHKMLLKGKRHNRMQFLILFLKVKKDFFGQKKIANFSYAFLCSCAVLVAKFHFLEYN
jgi:hypothetical protein